MRILKIQVLFILFFLVSCSSHTSVVLTQDDVFTTKPEKDQKLEKHSQSMQRFLMGQIEMHRENVDSAIANLEASDELIDKNEPLIDSDLVMLFLIAGKVKQALVSSERIIQTSPTTSNLLRHAGILEALDQYDQAEAIYDRILGQDAGVTQAYILLTTIYFQKNRFKDAEYVLQHLKKIKPEDPSSYYYLARTFELQADLAKAISILSEATKLWPKNERLGLDLTRLALLNKDLNRATSELKRLTELQRSSTVNAKLLAILQTKDAGSSDLALKLLSFLDALENDPTAVHYKTALAHIENNNAGASVGELLLVLAKQPENSRARYYLGSVFAALGRKKLALDELEKITLKDEMFIEARVFASYIYRQDRDLAKAEKVLREALQAQQRDLTVVLNLVDVLREARKLNEAKDFLSAAIEQNPNNDALLFLEGVVLHDLGEQREALLKMEEVIKINSKHTQAMNFLAYGLAEQDGDLVRAKELIEQALSFQPEDGFFLDTLGWIHYKAGRYQEAVNILARAVNVVGEDVVIMEHYADALEKTGELKRAREYYQEAIKLGLTKTDSDSIGAVSRIEKKLKKLPEEEKPSVAKN